MMPASLHLLGSFALVRGDGTPVSVTSRKNRALVAILALSPGQRATRERLAGLLWGDRGDTQARDSLRQAIAVLRKELGELDAHILNARGDLIELNSASISVDAVDLLSAAGDPGADGLRRAATLCRGELLADISLREAGFEEWLANGRRRLNEAAIKVFDQLASVESGQAQIDFAQRLVALDQLREASHRRLIEAYAAQGDFAMALQQFETLKRLLRVELGIAPSPESTELARLIQSGGYPGPRKDKAADTLPPQREAPVSPSGPILPSLAVLPFKNIGDDSEQEYFADGIVEDIITVLSRFKTFAVVARNSSFSYKNRNVDIREIASELGVRYVMEGSVRRSGNVLRITAQLADSHTGLNLWAETYDGSPADVFDFQDRITASVAMLVEPKIHVAELERSRRERPGSMAVYDIYLKALSKITSDLEEDVEEALGLLKTGLSHEPNNASLLSLAVRIVDQRVSQGKKPFTSDSIKECAEWAYRALQNAGGDSSVMMYCALALIQTVKDYETGMAVVQMAVENNPNSLMVVTRAGIAHLLCGDLDLSLKYFHRAIQLTPNNFEAHYSLTGIAHASMAKGDFPEAVRWATRSLLLNSHYNPTYWMLIAGNAQLGQMQEARRYLDEFRKHAPGVTIAGLRRGQPAKDPGRHAAIYEGLRMAGLAEE
jgi:TolB-like protein/DNA-binding SARP family transcriptional activator